MPSPFQQLQMTLDSYRQAVNGFLWQQDIDNKSFALRFCVRSIQILFAVVRDLTRGQLSLRAMSLVFTTIIGFLPLLALTFTVLKGLGAHNALEPSLLALLEPLGERSIEVTGQILAFVDELQVELIGITSIGLLFYFVIDMMRKIETSFNYIWAVKLGRSWSNRISEYLFAVIVSPLLLFISISITSYVNTNYFKRFLESLLYGSMVIEFIAVITPVLLMSSAFAFAYSFLPNTKVQFSSAFVGGFVTTVIWKLMGSVFQGIFVSSARESIYLAFATPIAVMLFTYFGWLVALIGSSIAFYHQHPAKARMGREQVRLSISQKEILTLSLAATIIRRFHSARPAMDIDQLAAQLKLSPVVIQPCLHTLESIGLVTKSANDPPVYLPCKAIHECKIVDIWQAMRHHEEDSFAITQQSDDLATIKDFQVQLDAIIAKELGNKLFIDS